MKQGFIVFAVTVYIEQYFDIKAVAVCDESCFVLHCSLELWAYLQACHLYARTVLLSDIARADRLRI